MKSHLTVCPSRNRNNGLFAIDRSIGNHCPLSGDSCFPRVSFEEDLTSQNLQNKTHVSQLEVQFLRGCSFQDFVSVHVDRDGQQLCKFVGRKKKFYIRKEFNLLTTLFPYTNMAAVSLLHTSIWTPLRHVKTLGSLYVSGKLPTYPSSKPALTLTPHLGQNVGLRKGQVGIFRMRIMIETFYILILLHQLSPLLPLLSRQASARGRLLHQGRAQESFSLAGWGQEAG